MRYALPSLSALGLVAISGCAGGTSSPEAVDAGFTVAVAPLDLPGIDFACYDLLIENGATPRETVISRGLVGQRLTEGDSETLCSTRFGNSAGGDIAYVAPCDASQPAHAVTLWVDGLYSGTPDAATLMDFQDPCPDGCTLTATCAENADTPVNFNLTIMRPANQGFFDVAVNFQNVFCSAKVDCEYGPGEPIELLHNPSSGDRERTVVVALACTTGPGSPTGGTVLLRDPITIDCAGADPIVLDPTLGEGNVYGPIMDDPDLDDAVWQYATYFGAESLPCGGQSCDKRYWNVAIGLDTAAAGCTLTTTAAASGANIISGFTTPEASTYPVITHTVPLTGPGGGLLCSQHPLNGEPGGVSTTYTLIDGPHTFCHRYDGTFSTDDSGDCGEFTIPACWEPPTPNCPDGTWVYEGDMFVATRSAGGEEQAPPEGYECISAITGNLNFYAPAGTGLSWDGPLNFAALETIGGYLWFEPETTGQVADVAFPRLTSVGELQFINSPSTTVDLPSLTTVLGDLYVTDLAEPKVLSLPAIQTIGGRIQLQSNLGTVTVSLGETRPNCPATPSISADEVIWFSNGLNDVSLTVAAAQFIITTNAVWSENFGVAGLETTGHLDAGRLMMYNNYSGTPEALVGGDLNVSELRLGILPNHSGGPNANVNIDVSGGLTVSDEALLLTSTGTLRVRASGPNNITPRLEVGVNEDVDIDLASPTTLSRGATISGNGGGSINLGVTAISLNDLNFTPGIVVSLNTDLTVSLPTLNAINWTGAGTPELLTVTGNTSLSLSAPALTIVNNGDLMVTNPDGPLAIDLPSLSTVHSLYFVSNTNLTASTLDLSSLSTVFQDFVFSTNAVLSTCAILELLDQLSAPPDTVSIGNNFDDTPCD